MATQTVTPFDVSGAVDETTGQLKAVDYDKLIRDFGATPISPELLERFERVTGQKPHRFLRRAIVISHRELEKILDKYEKGERFYLYTGRGPSSDSMHVGHSVPFEFTRYLQEVFDCPLVIQLTDDEKFMHSKTITVEDAERYTRENAKDIIAVGFDPKKTFIFSDFDYMGGAFYKNVCRAAKYITLNQIKGAFGFNDSNNIGEFHFPATQSAPSFATSFPHIFGKDVQGTDLVSKISCLIPCAIDQDPYFRVCRDISERMGYQKPCLIHSRFLPALQGEGTKMSASVDVSAIFLTDTPSNIKKKINKYAFSGGQDTAEKQKELGGRTDVDVPYKYLTFFLEDDEELARIKEQYEKGEMMTGEIKAVCIKELQEYVAEFQKRRAAVSDEVVDRFFSVQNTLNFKGAPASSPTEAELKAAAQQKPEKSKKDKSKGKKANEGAKDIPVR
ncbi:tryptophan--tRNA ligase [Cladophialophora chaetospira]|uniref:Tryptophan--tRNA ligase, cytoplasmic n=1 Tax=Cladophialophora chaetospira TaxID=386627 RepID=A0AA38WZ71_9EURO|nr:tryptophan--tRNA ligase [Cladophialophora chaetospira]